MTVSPGENHVFQAELTDGSGKIIDTFLYAGGEYGDSTVYLVIGIAGKDNEHLDILSKIAISLDDELVEKLKDSTDVNDFLNIFA